MVSGGSASVLIVGWLIAVGPVATSRTRSALVVPRRASAPSRPSGRCGSSARCRES
jgi:hypothetical protein